MNRDKEREQTNLPSGLLIFGMILWVSGFILGLVVGAIT